MPALGKVTAKDLMQTRLVTISDDATVEEAIQTLEDERISGAPVVDGGGNLVGVLSAFDVARREHVKGGRLDVERPAFLENEPGDGDAEDEVFAREDYSVELLGRERVRDWMHPSVITVAPDAGLKEICELMHAEGIHRVVVAEGGSPRGIVTTMDVVACLAERL